VITYYDVDNLEILVNGKRVGSLYDESYIGKKDQYGLFLHNNPGLIEIHNLDSKDQGMKRILVIKDSYGNSFVPFLVKHYEKMDVIDLRNYNGKVSEQIKDGDYDEVLILYNFISFSEDLNLSKLIR
jgi:hypothetical protein